MTPKKAKRPVAKAQLVIRLPVSKVFEAFVDPEVTARFWFSRGSGRLETGQQVRWEWDVPSFAIPVHVKAVERNKRIVIEWPAFEGFSKVEWKFSPCTNRATFVQITNSGFPGSPEQQAAQAVDSTSGFSFVLAGAKAFLEHGIELNLVADHTPDAPGLG